MSFSRQSVCCSPSNSINRAYGCAQIIQSIASVDRVEQRNKRVQCHRFRSKPRREYIGFVDDDALRFLDWQLEEGMLVLDSLTVEEKARAVQEFPLSDEAKGPQEIDKEIFRWCNVTSTPMDVWLWRRQSTVHIIEWFDALKWCMLRCGVKIMLHFPCEYDPMELVGAYLHQIHPMAYRSFDPLQPKKSRFFDLTWKSSCKAYCKEMLPSLHTHNPIMGTLAIRATPHHRTCFTSGCSTSHHHCAGTKEASSVAACTKRARVSALTSLTTRILEHSLQTAMLDFIERFFASTALHPCAPNVRERSS